VSLWLLSVSWGGRDINTSCIRSVTLTPPLPLNGLRERSSGGKALGLAGLGVMFNPSSFDWHDRNALLGNGCLLLAALSWAANILYVKAHKWISTPFQLTFWQTLLAGIISSIIAFGVEGVPHIEWTPLLLGALAFASVFGTALAYWAMAVANRSLPVVTTSLVLLATPVRPDFTPLLCSVSCVSSLQ
jgi:drug/metabolite transporter (DMT)-like permease